MLARPGGRACKSEESPDPTMLTTRFYTQSGRSSHGTLQHHPRYGNSTWRNGRFVQIQDGLGSKEMLDPIKGAHFPSSNFGNGRYIWLPVHRCSTGQAKQMKTSLFQQLNAIHLHRHQEGLYGD